MAGLSPAELRKRNNFSLFRTRIASNVALLLWRVMGEGEVVMFDPTVANTLISIDNFSISARF